MKKSGFISMMAVAFSLILAAATFAGSMSHGEGKKMSEGQKAEKGSHAEIFAAPERLIGYTVVDVNNEPLGIVTALDIDAEGEVRFLAIDPDPTVAAVEEEVLIPFGAFRPAPEAETLLVTFDQSMLAAAPTRDPGMSNDRYNVILYEFYGLAPYWEMSGEKASPEGSKKGAEY